MPISLPAFRRRQSATPRREYLYFPCEDIQIRGTSNTIAPALPGNDSNSEVTGGASPNFILDLGIRQLTIAISGTLQPLAATNYPVVGGSDVYIIDGGVNASAVAQTGAEIREALFEFFFSQADTAYATSGTDYAFEFVWPDWGNTASAVTVNSQTNCRVFAGNLRELNVAQRAGEIDQYQFNLTFIVGSP